MALVVSWSLRRDHLRRTVEGLPLLEALVICALFACGPGRLGLYKQRRVQHSTIRNSDILLFSESFEKKRNKQHVVAVPTRLPTRAFFKSS